MKNRLYSVIIISVCLLFALAHPATAATNSFQGTKNPGSIQGTPVAGMGAIQGEMWYYSQSAPFDDTFNQNYANGSFPDTAFWSYVLYNPGIIDRIKSRSAGSPHLDPKFSSI